MTKAYFIDDTTINVVTRDGEIFTLKAFLPVPKNEQATIVISLTKYFEEYYSDDKTSMIYWVLMKMMADVGFSFSFGGSDRTEDRERIGSKIRRLREEKGMEAKQLAILANIDPANLCRIEQGKYSVGLDILTKISNVLSVKVDLV